MNTYLYTAGSLVAALALAALPAFALAQDTADSVSANTGAVAPVTVNAFTTAGAPAPTLYSADEKAAAMKRAQLEAVATKRALLASTTAPVRAAAVRTQEMQGAGERPSVAQKLEMERTRMDAFTATTSANAQSREEFRQKAQERAVQMKAAAKERLAQVQDRVKQKAIERVSTQFDKLNAAWTEHLSNVLDRLGAILQKIQDRAAATAADGKDTAQVAAAIDAAATAIATAQAAVDAQAAKTYAPDVSSTAPDTPAAALAADAQVVQQFRDAFASLRATLFDDLKALRDGSVADARTAVHAALQALQQVPDAATSTEQ